MLVVIYVENPQKSCVECFLEVLSVRNVFPVLRLVGNVVRVVNNHQHLRILHICIFGFIFPILANIEVFWLVFRRMGTFKSVPKVL